MTTRTIIAVLFLCLVHSNSSDDSTACFTSDGSLVMTDYGCIRGAVEETSRSFTGIPYAKAPIPQNNLRFKNPIKHENWGLNTFDATQIATPCMQNCDTNSSFPLGCYKTANEESNANIVQSEDCLYLNIYTPPYCDHDQDDLFAVMFFIHGGSYKSQWSGNRLYNGKNLAYLNDVIVVTINYRMGSFGFLYDPQNNIHGNYGYYDQLFALEWVSQNIQYFGGDPANIILFGESAGAMAVSTLLMNKTNTMYSGAIMQSHPFGVPFRTHSTWFGIADKYLDEIGCGRDGNGACLCSKSVSSEQLLNCC